MNAGWGTPAPLAARSTARAALLDQPNAWPAGTAPLKVVETHMSWVFLTPLFAYKMKKPVRLPWLDLTTIDARHSNCLTELELNRRFSPHVYLDVVSLTEDSSGLAVDGGGPVVDWLVRMRRLPAERNLEHLIVHGGADPEQARPIAALLARFYAHCERIEIAPDEYRERFAAENRDNRRELIAFGLPSAEVLPVCDSQERFLSRGCAVLDARVGHIVEGHGDLRPEHLFLTEPPALIDCLEFSRKLRLLDPVDELAFLALECERLGASAMAEPFLTAYGAGTADTYPPPLFHFYQCFRAAVRARIAIWHNRNGEANDPGRWIARARDYLRLAARHAGQF